MSSRDMCESLMGYCVTYVNDMWESYINESHHIVESHTHEFARHMRITYGVTVSHMNEFARI